MFSFLLVLLFYSAMCLHLRVLFGLVFDLLAFAFVWWFGCLLVCVVCLLGCLQGLFVVFVIVVVCGVCMVCVFGLLFGFDLLYVGF